MGSKVGKQRGTNRQTNRQTDKQTDRQQEAHLLDWIAGVAEALEHDALDDTAIAHIQARDDTTAEARADGAGRVLGRRVLEAGGDPALEDAHAQRARQLRVELRRHHAAALKGRDKVESVGGGCSG
jgi:hypothetical protein